MAHSTYHRWWQTGIIYQIYPRSFQDSNSDGVGDLRGIMGRLEYLKSLNVSAIWLSPIYPSPMHDFGYDVADYVDIHPLFGTMDDFDALLEAVHQHDLKLILDLVPNHTSHEHAWFQESHQSRDNPKADWYIWRDPAPDGGPPNNWLSCFGGPAWTFDETRGQFYLHSFERRQPDLNYHNPEVESALFETMQFWLDRGVDGFRVDVIEFMLQDPYLRDEPENRVWDGVEPYGKLSHIYSRNQPEVHTLIKKMRRVVDSYEAPGLERVLIGEMFLFDETLMAYYGNADECHLPFNFRLIYGEWNAPAVRRMVESYEAYLPPGAWPNWVLGNHDQHRIATRIGEEQARVAQILLLTLHGTPFVYYGEEIGMHDVEIPADKVKDPPAVNQPEVAHLLGRDPERTPMQWDASPNAGFTGEEGEPWLPLADDFEENNVQTQNNDPASTLSLFKGLSELRKNEPALSVGAYEEVAVGDADGDVFAYLRRAKDADSFLIVLNMSENAHKLELSLPFAQAEVAVSSHLNRQGEVNLKGLDLSANEGLVLRLGGEQGLI